MGGVSVPFLVTGEVNGSVMGGSLARQARPLKAPRTARPRRRRRRIRDKLPSVAAASKLAGARRTHSGESRSANAARASGVREHRTSPRREPARDGQLSDAARAQPDAVARHQPVDSALVQNYNGKFLTLTALEEQFREYATKEFGTSLQQAGGG